MSAAIAKKMYEELEAKWRAAEREEQRCTARSVELAGAGRALLAEIEQEVPINEPRTRDGKRNDNAQVYNKVAYQIDIRRLSEEELSLMFAWLSNEEPKYWEAASGGLYGIFQDENLTVNMPADHKYQNAQSQADSCTYVRPSISVLRGVFIQHTKVPIGLLVTKSDGISIDFISIRAIYRRCGIAAAALRIIEANLFKEGILEHTIESLEGAIQFWRSQGYNDLPDTDSCSQLSKAAKERRLASRRRRLPMRKNLGM